MREDEGRGRQHDTIVEIVTVAEAKHTQSRLKVGPLTVACLHLFHGHALFLFICM